MSVFWLIYWGRNYLEINLLRKGHRYAWKCLSSTFESRSLSLFCSIMAKLCMEPTGWQLPRHLVVSNLNVVEVSNLMLLGSAGMSFMEVIQSRVQGRKLHCGSLRALFTGRAVCTLGSTSKLSDWALVCLPTSSHRVILSTYLLF